MPTSSSLPHPPTTTPSRTSSTLTISKTSSTSSSPSIPMPAWSSRAPSPWATPARSTRSMPCSSSSTPTSRASVSISSSPRSFSARARRSTIISIPAASSSAVRNTSKAQISTRRTPPSAPSGILMPRPMATSLPGSCRKAPSSPTSTRSSWE